MTIIWCMVPEIWSATEFFVILEYFLLFYPPIDPENQNFEKMKKTSEHIITFQMCHTWQSYDVWFLRYGVQRTNFFVILERFLPFYPPNNPKNQNIEKMKKTSGDIIILHRCNINDNHMMYGFWDIKCNEQNFLSFWTIFCPSTNQKINILKKWKNTCRYYHFTLV